MNINEHIQQLNANKLLDLIRACLSNAAIHELVLVGIWLTASKGSNDPEWQQWIADNLLFVERKIREAKP